MGASITNEQRQAIIALHETGEWSYTGIAQQVGVARTTVQLVVTDHRIARANGMQIAELQQAEYQCRAVGFDNYPAKYLYCPTCKRPYWNDPGAPIHCKLCGESRPVLLFAPTSLRG